MAINVNTAPEVIVYSQEDDCVPLNVVRDANGNPMRDASGNFKTSGAEQLDPGPAAARTSGVPPRLQVPKSFLASSLIPDPPYGIHRLSRLHVKAVMTMIAKEASGFSYTAISPANQVGKYQFDATMLTRMGYIKPEYLSTYQSAAVKQSAAWTGKDGIVNLESWFVSQGAQESAMFEMLNDNYNSMTGNEAIKSTDNLCTIAGMLCVAHILGPGVGTEKFPGAKTWRQTGGGADATGNTGALYFSLGRYAIDVLAAKNSA